MNEKCSYREAYIFVHTNIFFKILRICMKEKYGEDKLTLNLQQLQLLCSFFFPNLTDIP